MYLLQQTLNSFLHQKKLYPQKQIILFCIEINDIKLFLQIKLLFWIESNSGKKMNENCL